VTSGAANPIEPAGGTAPDAHSVFISYRRKDTKHITGRLHDALRRERPDVKCFLDVNSIPTGVDFSDSIADEIKKSRVVISMIGREWIGFRFGRQSRIKSPQDHVRREIELAFEFGVPILPVLVDDARIPDPRQLPESLEFLRRRNAARLRHDSFESDLEGILEAIDRAKLVDGSRLAANPSLVIPPNHSSRNRRLLGGFVTILAPLFIIAWSQNWIPLLGMAREKPPCSSDPSRQAEQGTTLVSFTFENGRIGQYVNAFPALKAVGMRGTLFLISDLLGEPGFMSTEQVQQVHAYGNEIGSNTRTHPNLTALDDAKLADELAGSKKELEARFGSVTSLAYPYGATNARVQEAAAKHYSSAKSTSPGLMSKGGYQAYCLTQFEILNSTSIVDIETALGEAKRLGAWLILNYHEIGDPDDSYTVATAVFARQVQAVKESGVAVKTVREAIELTS
jgi:peptidoglycan/xylan/chitin deacetylase (PgdA/CDA1 family)